SSLSPRLRLTKGSNISSWYSGAIPGPVSFTLIQQALAGWLAASAGHPLEESERTHTQGCQLNSTSPPLEENLSAFSSRIETTRSSLWGSQSKPSTALARVLSRTPFLAKAGSHAPASSRIRASRSAASARNDISPLSSRP